MNLHRRLDRIAAKRGAADVFFEGLCPRCGLMHWVYAVAINVERIDPTFKTRGGERVDWCRCCEGISLKLLQAIASGMDDELADAV